MSAATTGALSPTAAPAACNRFGRVGRRGSVEIKPWTGPRRRTPNCSLHHDNTSSGSKRTRRAPNFRCGQPFRRILSMCRTEKPSILAMAFLSTKDGGRHPEYCTPTGKTRACFSPFRTWAASSVAAPITGDDETREVTRSKLSFWFLVACIRQDSCAVFQSPACQTRPARRCWEGPKRRSILPLAWGLGVTRGETPSAVRARWNSERGRDHRRWPRDREQGWAVSVESYGPAGRVKARRKCRKWRPVVAVGTKLAARSLREWSSTVRRRFCLSAAGHHGGWRSRAATFHRRRPVPGGEGAWGVGPGAQSEHT